MKYLVIALAVLVMLALVFILALLKRKNKEPEGVQKVTYSTQDLEDEYADYAPRSLIDVYYDTFLDYVKFGIGRVVLLKLMLFILMLALMLLAHATNVTYWNNYAISVFKVNSDAQYQSKVNPEDEALVLQQEIAAYNYLRSTMNAKNFLANSKVGIMEQVQLYLSLNKIETPENEDLFANKVYWRTFYVYSSQGINWIMILLVSLAFSFVVEVILFYHTAQNRNKDNKNIAQLRKLLIISGTNGNKFSATLTLLTRNARPKIADVLLELQTSISRTNVSKHKAYLHLIDMQTNPMLRTFLMKLDEADNSDFSKSVKNINKEIQLEQNARNRKYKKYATEIDSVSVSLMFLIILFLCYYFFIPWQSITITT